LYTVVAATTLVDRESPQKTLVDLLQVTFWRSLMVIMPYPNQQVDSVIHILHIQQINHRHEAQDPLSERRLEDFFLHLFASER